MNGFTEGFTQEEAQVCNGNGGLVRPEGFEPPTVRFEAECSIQLSYGRGEKDD